MDDVFLMFKAPPWPPTGLRKRKKPVYMQASGEWRAGSTWCLCEGNATSMKKIGKQTYSIITSIREGAAEGRPLLILI